MFPTDWNGNPGFITNYYELQGTKWSVPHMEYQPAVPGKLDVGNYVRPSTGQKHPTYRLQPTPWPGLPLTKARQGEALLFRSAENINSIDYSKPAIRIEYVTRTYDSEFRDGRYLPNESRSTIHREHVFYYPSWCGDGVLDKDYGEVYDDGVNNGKP